MINIGYLRISSLFNGLYSKLPLLAESSERIGIYRQVNDYPLVGILVSKELESVNTGGMHHRLCALSAPLITCITRWLMLVKWVDAGTCVLLRFVRVRC